MRKAQQALRKEVKKLSKERCRGSFEDEAFAQLHEQYGKDLESKRDRLAALEQRVVNERMLMGTLGRLLDAKEEGLLQQATALSDPPFVAKVSIFCHLCDTLVRSLVGGLGRLGKNWGKAARAADEAGMRLHMYVRNVLYGDVPVLADDKEGRRRSCVSVAHSQLMQDLAAATQMDLELLRMQRGQELNLLVALASQLLQQRFECERCVDIVCAALEAFCKNCAANRAEDKREAQPNGARSYKDYLLAEQDKLLEALSAKVDSFRARLDALQGLVEAMRGSMCDFLEAVAEGTPFRLRIVARPPSDEEGSREDRRSVKGPLRHDGSGAITSMGGAGGAGPAGETCDADVRFWLQLNGLSRYAGQLGAVKWPALKTMTSEELRGFGVGSSDATRLRVVQLCLKIDYSDWYNVLCSGHLRKKGEGAKAGWRRRFFVLLSNRELLYFKSDTALKPQGSLFLSHVTEVACGEGRLVLLVTKGRTYEIEAESDADFAQWVGFFKIYQT